MGEKEKKDMPVISDMPSFYLVLSYEVQKILHLYLNLNARRKLKLHKCVDSLRCRAVDINKTLVV